MSSSEITANLSGARLVEIYPQTLGKRITIAKASEMKHIPVERLLVQLRLVVWLSLEPLS